LYNVDGIFFDEASSNCDNVGFYEEINQHTKQFDSNKIVVLNPGVSIPKCYSEAGDIFVVFEDTYDEYKNWQPSLWESKPQNKDRFWHLIHTTNEADVADAIIKSKQRNAGYVYVTDDTTRDNPWDTLPSYWDRELELVNDPNAPFLD